MPAALRGLTWNHPRGYGPLDALDRLDRAPSPNPFGVVSRPVDWERQPLEGFESSPIDDLADRFDLIVMDHPHVPDAVARGALVSLDEVIEPAVLERCASDVAGTSFDSYTYAGRQWAMPVDAATQVLVAQPGTPEMATWTDVHEYARSNRVALCIAGPHALNLLMSVLASLDERDVSETLDDAEALGAALQFLSDLRARTIDGVDDANPIQVLELMQRDPMLMACPWIYGYVNYAIGPQRLEFRNAPVEHEGRRPGSVLGGTGIAISAWGSDPAAAAEHVVRLASLDVQRRLVPDSGGQPVARSAWLDPALNRRFGSFYENTLTTLDAAVLRPRLPLWPTYQPAASAVVRECMTGERTVGSSTSVIQSTYRSITNS